MILWDEFFVIQLILWNDFTLSYVGIEFLMNVCLILCIWYREESDSVSETRDSFSDSFSDESESEKLSRWDGCSSDEGIFEQDSFWHPNERLGNLYLQYFERSSPYGRVPLTDKVMIFTIIALVNYYNIASSV